MIGFIHAQFVSALCNQQTITFTAVWTEGQEVGVGYVMLENTDLNIYNGASAVWHAALFVSLKAIFCLKKMLDSNHICTFNFIYTI